MLRFDPNREPTSPRDASTVIVLREAAGGLETFCVLRHARSGFLGGAVVFPGGKVDPSDADGAWRSLATEPHPRGELFASPQADARVLAVAACRETLEEGRILPVDQPLADAEVDALRLELAAGHDGVAAGPAGFASALARRGLRLAVDALVPWARWVTPEAESRRFDARFFLLELPPGQQGRHDEHETTMSFWARPADILDRFMRGELFLAPPTTRTLEMLAGVSGVSAARALAAEQSLLPICPSFAPDDVAPFLALPGDPAHPVAELRVRGPTRFVLRDGRFVSENPPGAAGSGGQTETT